jgi:bud site selection protein 31
MFVRLCVCPPPAESADQTGKRKDEMLWPIFRLHHQRSRYVYEMYYQHKVSGEMTPCSIDLEVSVRLLTSPAPCCSLAPLQKITKEVYEFALREKYADANLIAKWKKAGYEKLCCLRCIQPKDTNFGTTCICRVPSSHLEEGKVIECVHCGCRGCASGSG